MAKISINPIPVNGKVPEYGKKTSERINIETDTTIKKIIGSGLLLTKELYQLLLQLLSYSKQVNQEISLLEKGDYPIIKLDTIQDKVVDELLQSGYTEMQKTDKAKASGLLRKIINKHETKERTLKRIKMISEIRDLSGGIEGTVSNFEDSQGVDLGILPNIKLYVCKGCHQIVQRFKFSRSTCGCGRILNFTDTYSIFIAYINDDLRNFIQNNQWLEYGAEKLFQDCGHNTECGINLMGSSGTTHEIDVLGERDGGRIVVECKASDIEFGDVLKFYSKMMDLGIMKGLVFTTKPYKEIKNRVKKFSIAKNIRIVPSILDIPNEEIKKIVEGARGKEIDEIINNY